jgi:chorismate dehydratase
VPNRLKHLLGVSEASYLRPLLYGLEAPDSPFELLVDIPAEIAVKFRERTRNLRCAFLSPIDYARHGADYRIVPDVGVSSSSGTETIRLYVKQGARDIRSLSADIRVTSEIILAKIILLEKFPNLTSSDAGIQFIPMLPKLDDMLTKADAALVVNLHPQENSPEGLFALDLVEEWNDLTGLPYVHGFWVGRENPETEEFIPHLVRAKQDGLRNIEELARQLARRLNLPIDKAVGYFSSFSFKLGEEEQQGLSEFIRYAFYHGVLPDIPEINFFELDSSPTASVN